MRIYSLPNFNLIADIWDGDNAGQPVTLRVSHVPCQVFGIKGTPMPYLRFPRHTDVRQPGQYGPNYYYGDLINVPSGSHWWYRVTMTTASHPGFPNEYLTAMAYVADAPPCIYPLDP